MSVCARRIEKFKNVERRVDSEVLLTNERNENLDTELGVLLSRNTNKTRYRVIL